jgi:hypothetical protein
MTLSTTITENHPASSPSGSVQITPRTVDIDLEASLRPHLDGQAVARGWKLFKEKARQTP